MKKLLTTIFIFFYIFSFTQKKALKQELQFFFQKSTIVTSSVLEINNDRTFFHHLKFNGLGLSYKYFTKYELLFIELLYQQRIHNSNNKYYYYYSNQINIPIGYSLYFFKKTWFNPSIGIFINNNFIFNEKIQFSYGGDMWPFISITEENKIALRYQVAFALNGGLSFTIKKRYTLNINGFVNLFSNYKLNPKGDETIPYNMYGYNFGVGYKF